MPTHHLKKCSKTSYMYDMDMGCHLKGYTASIKAQWHGLNTCIREDFSQLLQIWGSICGCKGVSVKAYSHSQPVNALNLSYMYDIDVGCTLKGSTASIKVQWHSLHTCIRQDFSQLAQIWGSVCGGNGVSGKPYAHPQPEKLLKHITYVCHGHGMQFERFYSIKQIIVAWFAHLHQVGIHPTLTKLGNHLW